MNPALETFTDANTELDQMGNALAQGANMAPRLIMDTIIALRAVLHRHQPVERDRFCTLCGHCRVGWPCPDATDVLAAMGLPESEEDNRW